MVDEGIVYLTTASHSLFLKESLTARQRVLDETSKVWSFKVTGLSERQKIREKIGLLLNTKARNIAWVTSTSYAASLAADNFIKANILTKDSTVLIVENQFYSNVIPWQKAVESVKATLVSVEAKTSVIIKFLKENKNVIASLPTVLWYNGSLLDLEMIGRVVKEQKHHLFIDATQSLGATELDISKIEPDFLCASCFKWLLGPMPGAILYVKQDPWHKIGIPFDFHHRNTSTKPSDLIFDKNNSPEFFKATLLNTAQRFDIGGNPDDGSIVTLNTNLDKILLWKVSEISKYLKNLTNLIELYFIKKNKVKKVFDFPKTKFRCENIIGIRHLFKENFAKEATKYLKDKNIYVVERCGYLRFSPYLYNDEKDLNFVFSELDEFLKDF